MNVNNTAQCFFMFKIFVYSQFVFIGYAKELVYKHSDGSYSAFGEGPGLCGCMGFGAVDDVEENTQKPPSKPGSSWY